MARKVVEAIKKLVEEFVLIRNTKPRAHCINSVALGKKVALKPGINRVSKALWNWAQEQHIVKICVDVGDLEEITDTLKDLSAARAVLMVKETFSKEVLKDWLEEETRDKVKEAIANQLQAL